MKQILRYRAEVAGAIKAAIIAKQQTISRSAYWEHDILRRMQLFAGSGKLLRGSLLCYAYWLYSGKRPGKAIYKTAAALELAHAGLLIHDDIMDQDDLRRGRPAMQRQYQNFAVAHKLADDKRFGENMAICAGDFALFLAVTVMAEAGIDGRVIALFSRQMTAVCAGQMQDVYGASSPAPPSRAAIYKIMQTKTAAYSVSLPLVMGATLGGASPAVIEKLYNIGLHIGTIFQIRDDELGMLGDAQALGKPVGSDIRQGKKTLIYHYLLQESSKKDAQTVKDVLGNTAATTSDIRAVRQMVIKYGVQELLAKDVERLRIKVQHLIATLAISDAAHNELLKFADFCATRQA